MTYFIFLQKCALLKVFASLKSSYDPVRADNIGCIDGHLTQDLCYDARRIEKRIVTFNLMVRSSLFDSCCTLFPNFCSFYVLLFGQNCHINLMHGMHVALDIVRNLLGAPTFLLSPTCQMSTVLHTLTGVKSAEFWYCSVKVQMMMFF